MTATDQAAAGIITALGWGIDGRLPVLYEIGAKVLLALLAPGLLWATGFLTQEERAWISGKLDAVKAGLT